MILSEKQKDYLTEVINIGIGRAAAVLNKIVSSRVKLKVPLIRLMHFEEVFNWLNKDNPDEISLVSMGFKGDLRGRADLLFESGDAVKIVDLITDRNYDGLEMDQLRSSTLNEVGNIVLNSLIGSLGNLLDYRFRFQIPQYMEVNSREFIENHSLNSEFLIHAETHFLIKDQDINGSFMLFFEVGSLDAFLKKLENRFGELI